MYQDATSHELLRAFKNGSGLWQYTSVAGEGPGGYGFYAAAAFDGEDVVISCRVVDQPGRAV